MLPLRTGFGQARQAKKEDLVVPMAQSVIASAPAGVPAPLNVFV
jgi:hypothetical protein